MTGPRRVFGLQAVFLFVIAAIGVYIALIAGFIMWEARGATALRAETQSIADLFAELSQRATATGRSVRQTASVVLSQNPQSADLRAVADAIGSGPTRAVPRPFAEVPAAMRRPLARADAELARLENVLLETIALAELGRLPEARARLGRVDSVETLVQGQLRTARQVGLADLSARQMDFGRRAQTAVRVIGLWAVLGVMAVPVLLWFLYRRLRRPLARLDDGLSRVATGDLTTRVPVEFDDEVGRLTRHFNEMTRVLRERAEHQGRLAAAGELVAGVAHEVNNPLMAIALTAETQLDDRALPAEIRADLQQIVRQARRAGTLLRGLLKFARAGEAAVEDIDLNELAVEALDLVSYQFGVDEIDVKRTFDPALPLVRGDTARIEQVLVNLLSNAVQAVRASAPPRSIRVQTFGVDGSACLAVHDSGPGVAPEARERIFLPFFTTKGDEGTGLGLYISRQIARDAGGDLTLDREADGARFVLALPVSPAHAVPTAAPVAVPEAAGAPLTGLRVLVVDDEASVRRPLAMFLQRRGAEVHQAGDGLEALTLLERYTVDLILLDLRMPRMDGIEFYTELQRTRPPLAERVIVVSGDLRQLERTGGMALPLDRILAKPVDLFELERRVRAVATA